MSSLVLQLRSLEPWILRVAVAFPMIWAGVGGLRNPSSWIGYVPDFVESFLTKETFLVVHSILLITWGILLMTGPHRWFFALMAFVNLLGILMFFGLDDITFRDLGLLLVALALFAQEYDSSHLSSDG